MTLYKHIKVEWYEYDTHYRLELLNKHLIHINSYAYLIEFFEKKNNIRFKTRQLASRNFIFATHSHNGFTYSLN